MSLIADAVASLGLAGNAGDELRFTPNRRDHRANPQSDRRGRGHPTRRARAGRPALHEVFPQSAMTPRAAARRKAEEDRLDLAYNAVAQENAELEDDEKIPWVFPWQEQGARDARRRRHGQRAARRVSRLRAG